MSEAFEAFQGITARRGHAAGTLSLLTYRALRRLGAIYPCIIPRALVGDVFFRRIVGDVSIQFIFDSTQDLPSLDKAVKTLSRDARTFGLRTQPKKSGIVAATGNKKNCFGPRPLGSGFNFELGCDISGRRQSLVNFNRCAQPASQQSAKTDCQPSVSTTSQPAELPACQPTSQQTNQPTEQA